VAGRLARGELESRVMDALWAHEDWMTPAEVQAKVRRRPPLAYTTVLTILVRLWEKGMLERVRQGRAFAYRPVRGRNEHAAQRMREILATADDRAAALGHFADDITASEARQLRRALGERPQK
jgi:predicted transcriptional regulator